MTPRQKRRAARRKRSEQYYVEREAIHVEPEQNNWWLAKFLLGALVALILINIFA